MSDERVDDYIEELEPSMESQFSCGYFYIDDIFGWLPIFTDMSPEQRYSIKRSCDGFYVIRDACGSGRGTLFPYPIMGIETLEDAQMLLGKVIRGESYLNDHDY